MGEDEIKPLDWDEDMGEWICQAHGMYECSQLPECVEAFAAFNANKSDPFEKIKPGPRIDSTIPDQWAGETVNTRYDGEDLRP